MDFNIEYEAPVKLIFLFPTRNNSSAIKSAPTQPRAILHLTQFQTILHLTQFHSILHLTQFHTILHLEQFHTILHLTQFHTGCPRKNDIDFPTIHRQN